MARVLGVTHRFNKVLSFPWKKGDWSWSSEKSHYWTEMIPNNGAFRCFVVGFIGFLPTAEECRHLLAGTILRFRDGGSERTLFESPLDILYCVSQRDTSWEMVRKFLEDDDEWAGLATLSEVSRLLDEDLEFGGGVMGWFRFSKQFVTPPAGTVIAEVSVSDDVAMMLNNEDESWWASLRFFAMGQMDKTVQ